MEQLNEDLTRLSFTQLLLHYDPVEEFAFSSQFQDKIDAVGLIECVFEAQHIGMRHSHQHRNFLLQTFNFAALSWTTTLLELLHSIAHARILFNCQVYGRKMTLS